MPRSSSQRLEAMAATPTESSQMTATSRMSCRTGSSITTSSTPTVVAGLGHDGTLLTGKRAATEFASHVTLVIRGLTIAATHALEAYRGHHLLLPRAQADARELASSSLPQAVPITRRVIDDLRAAGQRSLNVPAARSNAPSNHLPLRERSYGRHERRADASVGTASRHSETTTHKRSSETTWRERIGMNLNGTEQPVIGVDGEATGQRALQRILVAMATLPTAESAEHRTGFHTPMKFGYRRRDGGGVRWVESPMLDVVVTYVNDTADGFAESIAATAAAAKANVDATRFRDLGELRYLIRSLHRFGAGLIRRIVLVVADEGHVPKWINRTSTEIPFAFVTHAELFPDPARELPTFNSFSIETVLHRIPGLSEYFLYFNNDMLLGRRLSLLDLFRPVAGGSLADGAVDVETVLYMDRLDTATPCELHVQQPSNAAVEIRCNSSQRGDSDQDRSWLSTAVYAHNKELVWNRLGVFPSHAFAHIFKLFHRPRLAFMVDDVLAVESRRTRENRFRRGTDLWVTLVFAYFDLAIRLPDLWGSPSGRVVEPLVDAVRAPECRAAGGSTLRRVGSGVRGADRLSQLELLRRAALPRSPRLREAAEPSSQHKTQEEVDCPRVLLPAGGSAAALRCLPCVDVTNHVRHEWSRRRVIGPCAALSSGRSTTAVTATKDAMAAAAGLLFPTKPFESADFIDRLRVALTEKSPRRHVAPVNNGDPLDAMLVNDAHVHDETLCVRGVGPSDWLARYSLSDAIVTKIDDYAASGIASNFVEERLFAPFLTTNNKPFYWFEVAEDAAALIRVTFAIAQRRGVLLSLTINDDLRLAADAVTFRLGYVTSAENLLGHERCSMEG